MEKKTHHILLYVTLCEIVLRLFSKHFSSFLIRNRGYISDKKFCKSMPLNFIITVNFIKTNVLREGG